MKISELKNLELFLTTLFQFFKLNNIQSSIQPVDDYDYLLSRIFNSEFLSYNCSPNIEHYGIDFKLSQRIEEAEVYMFLFGKNENNESSFLLIDFGEKDLISFFTFTWNQKILPPFMADFKNDEADEIMTFEDFKIFLEANKKQKKLTWIALD